ncbi:DeoR/GlpR family DNA-binding transcription regulator [Mesoplasma photuris]|uniref:DeoR/GlpR family DNA-binding transcription regulator n=1 Tax=Mesoplasma photuris TaxID=217731 RepID=UPI0004E0F228|nr:DeoR/GlpR family DNA-binding transcription regulator [Mesoplasma photuris]
MIKEQRYKMIIDFLENKDIVLTKDLLDHLDVPLTTLRRDLIELEHENVITKLHGGVKINKKNIVAEEEFESKVLVNIEEKREIAKKAVAKIKKNESIFIDSGSNGYFISQILDPNLNLKIVTNSMKNVQELSKNGHQDIYILGGKFKSTTEAILGYEAIEHLKKYNFDKAFIGINAIDKNGNIFTTSSDHAQIKIEIINRSEKAYGLADSSKMNAKSFYVFSNTKDLELIS